MLPKLLICKFNLYFGFYLTAKNKSWHHFGVKAGLRILTKKRATSVEAALSIA
jgi:hypothetical protein